MVPAGLQVVAASAAQIWGDRFENEFADLSELQEHIASAKKSRRSWLSNLYQAASYDEH
jgi:TolB-like protein